MNRLILTLALLVVTLLAPCARANTATITVPGNSRYSFISNPLDDGTGNGFLDVLLPSEAGMEGGESVYVWDCSRQDFVPVATFVGMGIGTGLGEPSDWIVIDPAYQILYGDYDVGNDVYWLDPAKSPPGLPPGVGFFFQNPSALAETLTFNGTTPVQNVPSPAPCGGCGNYNSVASLYTSPATFQDITGSAPVNGSKLKKWNGYGWDVYLYTCAANWTLNGTGVPDPVVAVGQSVMIYTPCTSTPCSVVVSVEGLSCTVPGYTLGYALTVNNFSGGPVSDTLNLTGIPGYMTLTPPAGSTPVPGGFQVSVSGLANGASTSFFFLLNCGGTIGQFFTMTPAFATVPFAPFPLTVTVKSALDPNDKTGPLGIGANHYLSGSPLLPYAISFENQPSATAPAQRVVITDQLDPATLALGSFQFGSITFGNEVVTPPFGVNPYSATVLSYNANGNVVNVQINATNDIDFFSPTYGQVTWAFQTLDPNTGLPPTDPSIGFLPPNSAPPEGQGMVTYSVDSSPNLVTGDLITNSASIVFDANSAIATGTWTNTIITTWPALTIEKVGDQVKLTWATWTLVEATSLDGPWTPSAVQVSPWTFTPTGSTEFYRLQAP